MNNIDQTLAERGSRYGEFDEHARITQNIKSAIVDSRRWADLDDDMRECLDMIAHKIGRIVNGDPTYIDSWTDIIGYTRLVEKRLIGEQQTAKVFASPVGGTKQPEAAEPTIPTKGVDAGKREEAEQCDCVFCRLEQLFGKQVRA